MKQYLQQKLCRIPEMYKMSLLPQLSTLCLIIFMALRKQEVGMRWLSLVCCSRSHKKVVIISVLSLVTEQVKLHINSAKYVTSLIFLQYLIHEWCTEVT